MKKCQEGSPCEIHMGEGHSGRQQELADDSYRKLRDAGESQT